MFKHLFSGKLSWRRQFSQCFPSEFHSQITVAICLYVSFAPLVLLYFSTNKKKENGKPLGISQPSTPPKFNMESEKKSPEKEVPLGKSFSGSMLNFGKVP